MKRCGKKTGALILAFVMTVCAAGPAFGQAVPENIPDEPEGLDEKTERQLEERHHEFLSRLFSASQAGLVAQRTEPGLGVLIYESIGLRLKRDRSLALAWGLQLPGMLGVAAGPEACVFEGDCFQATVLFAAQYELPLEQVMSAKALPGRADRYRVGVGLGLRSGPVDAARLSVTPQYAVPVNRYWTLSLGATAGMDAIGELSAARPFMGAQVGVTVFPWGRRFDVLR